MNGTSSPCGQSNIYSQSFCVHKAPNENGLNDLMECKTTIVAIFYDEVHANCDATVLNNEINRIKIGPLQFVASRSRANIAMAVVTLSQYAAKPTNGLVKFDNRVFDYLEGTMYYGTIHNADSTDKVNLQF